MTLELKEDDIVMCTVKKIEGTTVFVDIENNGQGTIVFSEVAAGRIRNIRDYVSPDKKIVCKVLKLSKDHAELSLRRVTTKEKEEIKEKYEKERNLLSMLKSSTKKPEEIFKKIREDYEALDFLEEARANPKIIEKFFPKAEAEVFAKILSEKREKEKVVKKNIIIKSLSPTGMNDIKEALLAPKDVEMHYLGSSKFSISSKAKDFKEANIQINAALEKIKAKAKEKAHPRSRGKMIITIVGSIAFHKEYEKIKKELENKGHKVIVPLPEEFYQKEGKFSKLEAMQDFNENLEKSDAILVANFEKHGKKHYIGINSLMEIGMAFNRNKKIFLLYDIPEGYEEELKAIGCMILKGDITKLS